MSHFTVLVIGDDVDSQLESFDENTEVAPYSRGEVSQEDKDSFMEYYRGKHLRLGESTFDEMYEEFGDNWNGGDWTKNDDGVWENFSTYNPNSKWDWYQIGGRWSNYFKLKPNARMTEMAEALGMTFGEIQTLATLKDKNLTKFHSTVDKYKGKEDAIKAVVRLFNSAVDKYSDQTEKGTIDIEGMRNDSKENALAHYDLVSSAFNGAIPKLDLVWSELVAEVGTVDGVTIDGQRDRYGNQSAMLILKTKQNDTKLTDEQKSAISGWGFDLGDYQISREQYGENASKRAMMTYAVVKDGEWFQKGKMGWFGMSKDEMTEDAWIEKFNELVDSASDDTVFTLVDCHI